MGRTYVRGEMGDVAGHVGFDEQTVAIPKHIQQMGNDI